MAFNWSCPYCNRAQSVTDTHHHVGQIPVPFSTGADGRVGVFSTSVLCANPECKRTVIELSVYPQFMSSGGRYVEEGASPLFLERVLPRGGARPQPDYIPKPLVDDYVEACLIKDLSPKASATLSRRCLQGMIRHFAGINRSRLVDEIKALRTAVDDGSAPRSIAIESVDAIDHVRGIGNIGAHMERDISVIVDVDPKEAGVLIDLIEMLFREWYVERHSREQRLARITALGQSKGQQLTDARAAGAGGAAPPDAA